MGLSEGIHTERRSNMNNKKKAYKKYVEQTSDELYEAYLTSYIKYIDDNKDDEFAKMSASCGVYGEITRRGYSSKIALRTVRKLERQWR